MRTTHPFALARTLGAVTVIALALTLGRHLAAQSPLVQLGLTETAARTFVLNEVKSASGYRRSDTVIAGTRAFLKLPAAARGAAATGLFAWAKAYVNSPAFKASYEGYRKGRIPQDRVMPSIDEVISKEAAERLAGLEETKKNLAASTLPLADQEKILAQWTAAQAQSSTPEFVEGRRRELEAERAAASASTTALLAEVERLTPADPQKLFARRLREFLEATADVDFSARTINLTGGTDGIEFVDRADRQRPWIWQEAVIVGPEATAAARAAAQAWLQEIER